MPGFFHLYDPMAALGEHNGGGGAGRPAADDQYIGRVRRFSRDFHRRRNLSWAAVHFYLRRGIGLFKRGTRLFKRRSGRARSPGSLAPSKGVVLVAAAGGAPAALGRARGGRVLFRRQKRGIW